MKKYTYSGSRWLLLGMVLPILMFFFAMNTVYAYFTATATPRQETIGTGIVKIVFDGELTVTASESSYVDAGKLLPGQTITLSGTVENQGTSSVYALIKIQPVINDVEGTAVYYSPNNKLVYDGTNYQASGYTENDVTINKPTVNGQTVTYTKATFSINHLLDFDYYTNDYQGKNVQFKVTGIAIQTQNIDYDDAVEYLINNIQQKVD